MCYVNYIERTEDLFHVGLLSLRKFIILLQLKKHLVCGQEWLDDHERYIAGALPKGTYIQPSLF